MYAVGWMYHNLFNESPVMEIVVVCFLFSPCYKVAAIITTIMLQYYITLYIFIYNYYNISGWSGVFVQINTFLEVEVLKGAGSFLSRETVIMYSLTKEVWGIFRF